MFPEVYAVKALRGSGEWVKKDAGIISTAKKESGLGYIQARSSQGEMYLIRYIPSLGSCPVLTVHFGR